MITQINTINDVKEFATHLVQIEKLSFHPEDDFNDYVNIKTREAFYTKEEAQKRNYLMNKCFHICEKLNVEIYEILLPIIQKPFLV